MQPKLSYAGWILIRRLDSEINSLSDSADTLEAASERLKNIDASNVSGDDMDALFGGGEMAASDMESSVRYAKDKASKLRDMTALLENAMNGASDTPSLGVFIAEGAAKAAAFRATLTGLESSLQSYESALASLSTRFRATIADANGAHAGHVARWLQNPAVAPR